MFRNEIMIDIKENVPLAPLTTFRIGGNAKYFVEVRTVEELQEVIAMAKDKQWPHYVIGGGSNILVSDKGFDGLIIRMKLSDIKIDGTSVIAEAGVSLIKLINDTAKAGLTGLELLAGIPGTFGGAVRGNAGAFGSSIGDAVESVLALDVEKDSLITMAAAECDFSYRNSFFKKNPQYIIVSARLQLQQGATEDVAAKIKATIEKRIANELSGEKSAGSYFMNPIVSSDTLRSRFESDKGMPPKDEKLPAGWLIDQMDLRGKTMGGAKISEKHANYIINTGSATAEDVIMLESYVKQQVRHELGVQLQSEVSYVGF